MDLIWSTESYALVRSTKHTHNGICFFRAQSCSRRIINIILVVKRFGRKPLCSSGRISTRAQYSLRRLAKTFSIMLSACTTSEMPFIVAAICPVLLLVEYHDDGTFPPLLRHLPPPSKYKSTISSSLRCRVESPLRVIMNSPTETPSGPTSFPSSNERMAPSTPASWAQLLAACSPANGQVLWRCSGRVWSLGFEKSVEQPDPYVLRLTVGIHFVNEQFYFSYGNVSQLSFYGILL